jgi:hypothetical protein
VAAESTARITETTRAMSNPSAAISRVTGSRLRRAPETDSPLIGETPRSPRTALPSQLRYWTHSGRS